MSLRRLTRSPRLWGSRPNAPERLQAGVLHAQGMAADEGHTLLPDADLVRRAVALLQADDQQVAAAVIVLLETGDLVLGVSE